MATLYHPICHLINEERLYYLLLESKLSIPESAICVKSYLEDGDLKSLKKSYCGYFTFGATDFLLRIWSNEEKIAALINNFRRTTEISKVTTYVIDSMNTWYQRNLEEREDWPDEFPSESYEALMKLEIPDWLKLPFNTKIDDESIKYFMFLDETYTKQSVLFKELSKIIARRDEIYDKCFDGIEYISLYSYYTKTHQGVLIKGQTDDLYKIAGSTNNIAEIFKLNTTTFICYKKMTEEGDDIGEEKKLPLNARKTRVIYNLLKSHDCYEKLFTSEGRAKSDGFCSNLKDERLVGKLFHYGEDWWILIEELRRVYRWVVFRKNETLMDFLRGQYVRYEKYFRDMLENRMLLLQDEGEELKQLSLMIRRNLLKKLDLRKKVPSEILATTAANIRRFYLAKERGNKQSEEHFTFGLAPRILQKLLIISGFSKGEKKAIKELIAALESCIPDRNRVMHGGVTDLSEHDEKKEKWVWESYTLNIIRLGLVLRRYRKILQRLVVVGLNDSEHTKKLINVEGKKVSGIEHRKVGKKLEEKDKEKRFKMALSFAGTRRAFVKEVVTVLVDKFGRDKIYYDKHFEHELASADLDTFLQRIYQKESEMIVVFLCSEYAKKNWCRVEWRAIRGLINAGKTSNIMFMRFDDTEIPGLFDFDGYLDIKKRSADEVSRLIIKRYGKDWGK